MMSRTVFSFSMSSSGMDMSNSPSNLKTSSMASSEFRPRSSVSVLSGLIEPTSRFSSLARMVRTLSLISVFDIIPVIPPMRRWSGRAAVEPLQHERGIVAPEPERVDHGHADGPLLRSGGDARQPALRVGVLVVDRRMHATPLHGQGRDDRRQATGRGQRVSDQRLGRADYHPL